MPNHFKREHRYNIHYYISAWAFCFRIGNLIDLTLAVQHEIMSWKQLKHVFSFREHCFEYEKLNTLAATYTVPNNIVSDKFWIVLTVTPWLSNFSFICLLAKFATLQFSRVIVFDLRFTLQSVSWIYPCPGGKRPFLFIKYFHMLKIMILF